MIQKTRESLVKLNLSDPKYRVDPWSEFTRLRQKGSVIRIKMPMIGKVWAVTTYQGVSAFLKDHDQFVRDPSNAGRTSLIPYQWLLPRSLFSFANNMLGADGLKHRRLRSLVDRAFLARNIDSLESRIDQIARRQLSPASQVMIAEGKVDLLHQFALPFPLTVICELLGLPVSDRPKFINWFKPFSTVNSVFGVLKIAKGIKQLSKYLQNQIRLA
ncbi:MAG: hypothetical protein AAF939_20265, partial [Planctomycetota bacterium]